MTNEECMREIRKAVAGGLIPVEVGKRAYKAMDRDDVVEPGYEKMKNRAEQVMGYPISTIELASVYWLSISKKTKG